MYIFMFVHVFYSTVKDRWYYWLDARERGKHAGKEVLCIHFTCLTIDSIIEIKTAEPDRGNMLQSNHVVGLESMLDFSIYVFGDLDAIKVAKLYWPLSRKSS